MHQPRSCCLLGNEILPKESNSLQPLEAPKEKVLLAIFWNYGKIMKIYTDANTNEKCVNKKLHKRVIAGADPTEECCNFHMTKKVFNCVRSKIVILGWRKCSTLYFRLSPELRVL